MKKRIFSAIFIVSLILIVVITASVTGVYYSSYSSNQVNQLKEESQLVIRGVELNGKSYFDDMEFDNYRVTWIKTDGTVIYDTASDSQTLENHLERKEVQQALETGYGQSKRYSNTILKESFYVAYKINDGSIIRLSYAQGSVFYLLISVLYPLYCVAFVALAAAVILAFVLTKKITDPINKIDLENLPDDNAYPEIKTLLNKIESQKQQLIVDKEKIEQTSLLRQEFTANVSHEMKTPLHIIAGYSELIKEGMVKESEIKEFAKKINFESYRMTKLVDDILSLSKLDNGVLDEEKKDISLDLVVNNVIDSLIDVANERNITIKKQLEPSTIYASSNIIYSMVYNLIDNAIKYNKENGEIDVTIVVVDNKTLLKIADTGIGIPADQLDRIFERFYRVDKSHSNEIGGTGLGLSIVKHAALVHGAKMEVESTVGKGTTFKVIF